MGMTIEETIKVLDDMKIKIDIPKSAITQRKRNEALDKAIKALEVLQGIEDAYLGELLKTPDERGVKLYDNEDNQLVIDDLVDAKDITIIPYPTDESCKSGTLGLYTLEETLERREKANIAAWLSSFNTDSAPICFNKIQELKRECEKE